MGRRTKAVAGGAALLATLLTIAWGHGWYAARGFVTHGGVAFVGTSGNDAALSPSTRLALGGHLPPVGIGSFAWKPAAPGLETAEMPVIAGGREVDRVLLARVDTSRMEVVVRDDPAGRDLDAWVRDLGAAVVVGGPRHAGSGLPAMPLMVDGDRSGPLTAASREGALVSSPDDASVHDLSRESWQAAFTGGRNALVSYPLLLGDDGRARAMPRSGSVANRSFVGGDRKGRIVFGTTTQAYFTNARLADALQASPLDLGATVALDVGPFACQAVSTSGASRCFCGDTDVVEEGGDLWRLAWTIGSRWRLPIVVAAVPRKAQTTAADPR